MATTSLVINIYTLNLNSTKVDKVLNDYTQNNSFLNYNNDKF